MNKPHTYTVQEQFEDIYIKLRKKESRLHTDEELIKLPEVSRLNPNYHEWQLRGQSYRRILKWIINKKRPLTLLEVGCGNGWLSARLAAIDNITITGIDINKAELEQAKRVFGELKNLDFVYGDLRQDLFGDRHFDIILFAASLQYFPSLEEIITVALQHLSPQGEIHIVDSPFYSAREVIAARKRSKDYFDSVKFDSMIEFYHHHDINDLMLLHPRVLYDPLSWKIKLRKHQNPFYHFIIKPEPTRTNS